MSSPFKKSTPKNLSKLATSWLSFIFAASKYSLSVWLNSKLDNWITAPSPQNEAAIISTTKSMLMNFGTLFFFNHLIIGKNINAKNMDETKGMKMKESVLRM